MKSANTFYSNLNYTWSVESNTRALIHPGATYSVMFLSIISPIWLRHVHFPLHIFFHIHLYLLWYYKNELIEVKNNCSNLFLFIFLHKKNTSAWVRISSKITSIKMSTCWCLHVNWVFKLGLWSLWAYSAYLKAHTFIFSTDCLSRLFWL